MKRPTTKDKALISSGVSWPSPISLKMAAIAGSASCGPFIGGIRTLIGRTFGRRIDAIQNDFLAWHVTSEGLFSYFLKNLLGLPFGQLLKCSSDLILGSRGSAGISGLEWAAARFTFRARHDFPPYGTDCHCPGDPTMGFNCANVKVGKRRCGDKMLPLDLAALAPSAIGSVATSNMVMLEAPTSRVRRPSRVQGIQQPMTASVVRPLAKAPFQGGWPISHHSRYSLWGVSRARSRSGAIIATEFADLLPDLAHSSVRPG